MKGLSFAFSTSLVLHLGLVALLLFSVSLKPVQKFEQLQLSVPVLEAVVVQADHINKQLNAVTQKEQAEQQKRRRDAEKRKRAERAAAIAREKKRKEEAEKERQRHLAEEKKRQAQEQAEAEKAAKQAEQKRKRDAQEKLRAEQAQKRNGEILSEKQKYQALIKQTIQENLLLDEAMKGKICRLNIRLSSSGFVIQVKVLKGDSLVCDAAQRAIYKLETLPVSSDAEVTEQLKNINLTVEPEF